MNGIRYLLRLLDWRGFKMSCGRGVAELAPITVFEATAITYLV
ncbi:MAG TPA: hypothetical protein VKB81_13120 [Nitrospira sp.]|nr:hypothetical protein [Nitrospira sp.]